MICACCNQAFNIGKTKNWLGQVQVVTVPRTDFRPMPSEDPLNTILLKTT